MSELDYLKGRPIIEAARTARVARFLELKRELEELSRIGEQRLAAYVGKRESKNKSNAAHDYRFHRDLLAFLEMVGDL